ncbi:ABC transporter permease [Metallosphaera hakonensis]|uniref:ABC transporter permease n=1 Tax=Metallosphaera hakonensis TaxID=79601 RepID=UPI00278C6526|nr:ABC transporter permease [Metallosphaera hakonensis]
MLYSCRNISQADPLLSTNYPLLLGTLSLSPYLQSPSFNTLVGTMTLFIFLDGFLSISQQISFMKTEGHLTLLYVSGSPKWLTAISTAFVTLVISIPLALMIVLISGRAIELNVNWVYLTATLILSLLGSVLLGLDLGLTFTQRQVNQLSQVLGLGLSFFAPTFVPFSSLPIYFRVPSLLEPTTYVAQALRSDLQGSFSWEWNLGIVVIIFISILIYSRASRRP